MLGLGDGGYGNNLRVPLQRNKQSSNGTTWYKTLQISFNTFLET